MQATLSLQLRTVKEAQEEMEETVYEYQEWGVLSDWDAMAHPGRYTTAVRVTTLQLPVCLNILLLVHSGGLRQMARPSQTSWSRRAARCRRAGRSAARGASWAPASTRTGGSTRPALIALTGIPRTTTPYVSPIAFLLCLLFLWLICLLSVCFHSRDSTALLASRHSQGQGIQARLFRWQQEEVMVQQCKRRTGEGATGLLGSYVTS